MIDIDSELAVKLFNEAVKLKRAGKFKESIDLLKASIKADPYSPDILQNYYSMGKTYYLLGYYFKALDCYKVYNGLCCIKNPPIISDYKYAKNGSKAAKSRLLSAFDSLALHVGYASLTGLDQLNSEISQKWYSYTLMGKNPLTMPDMEPYQDEAENWDCQSMEMGYQVIFNWFNEFAENNSLAEDKIYGLASALLK